RDSTLVFLPANTAPGRVLQPPQRGFARTTNELYCGEPTVDSLLIGGPYQPAAAPNTPSRRKIFICRPATQASEDGCARRILSTLARRADRRPPADAEGPPPVRVYRARRPAGDFDLGIERGLRRILSSPSFLFRIEHDPLDSAQGKAFAINPIDLASRLSFFLWSSIPDDELLNMATAGTLSNSTVLDQQVR